jgi:hypothetical protein
MQQVLSIASQIPIHDSQDAFRGRHTISAIGKALLCCTIVKNVSKEPQKSDASQCRALHGAHIAHFVAVITSQDQKKAATGELDLSQCRWRPGTSSW